jgi:hypothetical protein
MTTKEQLIAGRERIAAGWSQGAMAEDKDGMAVEVTDPTAVSFCALGALVASGLDEFDAELVLHSALPTAYRNFLVSEYSDSTERTKDDILALYYRAIERQA